MFADDGKHYQHTFIGPPTRRDVAVHRGAACAPVWQAQDEIAEYGLRAPKYLEFKADDGTTLYGRLLLPPDGAGQRQDSADREYLWRPRGTDGA